MFDTIVESVLNEISAEDAYNKFYSNIPRDIFDKYLALYGGKFDAIMKFVLNNVKELENNAVSRKYAVMFLQKYKNAENNVRMAFLKKFKNGEFEDLTDAIQGLNDLEKEGVSTSASIQKDGYVELYNDKRYLLTCTLTYEASQHYYGRTKWCTASDRLGRYDGWYYFLGYIFNIDFPRDNDTYSNLGTNTYPIKCVLIQFTDNTKNETYQVQVFKNREFGQICDSEDISVDVSDFVNNILPEELENLIYQKLPELIAMEKKCFATEYKYQTNKNQYIDNKREMIEQRNRIKRREMEAKIVEEEHKKCDFIQKKVDTIKESNILSNTDFLKQIIVNSFNIKKEFYDSHNTTKEIAEKYEEILKSQSYLYLYKMNKAYDNIFSLNIRPIFGHMHDVMSDYNNRIFYQDTFVTSPYSDTTDLNGCFLLFVEIVPNEDSDYQLRMFNDVTRDFEFNGEETFKNFEIKNIITIQESSSSIRTKQLEFMVSYPFMGRGADDSILKGITVAQSSDDKKTSYKFINFKTRTQFTLTLDTYLQEILAIGKYILISDIGEDGYSYKFHTINLETMTLEKVYRGGYIRNSDWCCILIDPDTKDMYITTNKFFKLGLKAKNSESLYCPSYMYNEQYVVFNNDLSARYKDDCKVFDVKEGRIIIMNGRYEEKFKQWYVHVVIDKDTNEELQLD